MSFIYLASPYSHPLESVQASRFEAVLDACAILIRRTIPVYSPIVHWHPVVIHHKLPGHDSYWQFHNDVMMDACAEMWVLALPGWRESTGVTREIDFINRLKKPLFTIPPEGIAEFSENWRYLSRLGRTQQVQDPQPPR